MYARSPFVLQVRLVAVCACICSFWFQGVCCCVLFVARCLCVVCVSFVFCLCAIVFCLFLPLISPDTDTRKTPHKHHSNTITSQNQNKTNPKPPTQSFVYGDSLRAQLVAVAVPDPEHLLPWARERGLAQDVPSLCREPAVAAAVFKSLQEEGRAAQLRGFEQVHAVELVPEPFTVENGLLTPTFKLKRPQAREAFRALIDQMYARLPAGEGGAAAADAAA